MKHLLVALATVACGRPAPDCITPCGLPVYGTQDCDGANAAEARALYAFKANVAGWDRATACPWLQTATLAVRETEDGTFEVWGTRAAGVTWLPSGDIEIGTAEWKSSAFTHELAHVLELRIDQAETDDAHSTWAGRGIKTAIAESNRPPAWWPEELRK